MHVFLKMFAIWLLSFPLIYSFPIGYINNVFFVSISDSNITIITNRTCEQCLCLYSSSAAYLALNCLPNDTCRLFETYPLIYKIQDYSQARLYFLQGVYPNETKCCQSNTTDLISKINNASRISVYVPSPRCLTFDDYGYLVTVSQTNQTLVRMHPSNLTIIDSPVPPIFSIAPMTITYYNQTYFVAFVSYILLVDTTNLTITKNVSSPMFSNIRDLAFIDNGQILIVVSTSSATLVILNRTADYSLIAVQSVNQIYPHGLKYITDNFFYLTSWNNNNVYLYSRINTTYWKGEPFIDATSITSTSDGNHVLYDQCGRYWFSLGSNGIKLFNIQTLFVGNLNLTKAVFDTIITNNYTIYISDSSSNQIIRLEPQIECFQ